MPVNREPKNAIDPMTGQPSGGRFASNGPKPMGDMPSIDIARWDESTIVGHALSEVDSPRSRNWIVCYESDA